MVYKLFINTFLLGREMSDSVELSLPLDDDELEPDDELLEDVEVDTEVLPLGLAFGGISGIND